MSGSATFTIVMSSSSMNVARADGEQGPPLALHARSLRLSRVHTGVTLDRMPTTRRRHAITETPPVQAALDELRKELGTDRVELGELVVLGAEAKVAELRAEARDRRRAAPQPGRSRSGRVTCSSTLTQQPRRGPAGCGSDRQAAARQLGLDDDSSTSNLQQRRRDELSAWARGAQADRLPAVRARSRVLRALGQRPRNPHERAPRAAATAHRRGGRAPRDRRPGPARPGRASPAGAGLT